MSTKINTSNFRVPPGDEIKLKAWPTQVKSCFQSKKHDHKLLGKHVEELSELQRLLYASNRHALLLIFQAMDAAGKVGAIVFGSDQGLVGRFNDIVADHAIKTLAAMQRADRNIDELLETLHGDFHRLRQSGIDEELFDVISGYEALANKHRGSAA